jgi:hypothetical protein
LQLDRILVQLAHDSGHRTMQAELDGAFAAIDGEYGALTHELRALETELTASRDCHYVAFKTVALAVAAAPATAAPLVAFMRAVQATKEAEEERARARLDAVLQRMSELEIARARALGMGADARYPTVATQQKRTKKVLYKVGHALTRAGYKDVEVIAHARVALVKLYDPRRQLAVDLVPNRALALHNSDLIRRYLQVGGRLI